MIGPGVYDEECTQIREQTGAESVVLAVLGGNKGHGFSVQSYDLTFNKQVPTLLRKMADLMDQTHAMEDS